MISKSISQAISKLISKPISKATSKATSTANSKGFLTISHDGGAGTDISADFFQRGPANVASARRLTCGVESQFNTTQLFSQLYVKSSSNPKRFSSAASPTSSASRVVW